MCVANQEGGSWKTSMLAAYVFFFLSLSLSSFPPISYSSSQRVLLCILLRLLNGINQASGHITRGATVEMQFNDGTDATLLFSSTVIFSLSSSSSWLLVCRSLLFRLLRGESCQHFEIVSFTFFFLPG